WASRWRSGRRLKSSSSCRLFNSARPALDTGYSAGTREDREPIMRAPTQFSIDQVVLAHSPRMRAIFDFVKVVSRSDSSVIITGESGTGKEVVANMLHHQSSRRPQPFVAVSCALFSESLIETELFGHERGAFTGAIKD